MSASGSLLIPPLIHSILDRQKEVWRAARGKYWALLNVVFLACLVGWGPSPALLSSFLPASARTQRLLWMFRGSLIFVCVLNLFYHGWKLLFPWGRGQKDLVITQEQMDLMHIARERHPGFQVSPKSASGPRHPNPFKPLPGSFMSSPAYGSPSSLNTSSQSPRNDSGWSLSPDRSDLPANGSFGSNSWIFQRNNGADSPSGPARRSSLFNSSLRDIQDEQSLNEYLEEYTTWEKSHLGNVSLDPAGSPNQNGGGGVHPASGSSFWKSHANAGQASTIQDYSPVLKNFSYALSTAMPGSLKKEDPMNQSSNQQKESICYRVGIDPLELVNWLENLRMWISQTILARLVKEIEDCNKQLKKLGMTESVLIGEAGLERVRKISSLPSATKTRLWSLIPFLELSVQQDYIVSRIKELSEGGAMSEFKWNGGGRYKGKDWTDKLPTDSELIMHCVACYLDARLPPIKGVIDGKAFSSLYFFKLQDVKPQDLSKIKVPCAIVQTSLKPPHYILQIGEDKMDLSPGRNNLFHTLLLFLFHIKTKENGMLGRINFGRSGINILWVIEERVRATPF